MDTQRKPQPPNGDLQKTTAHGYHHTFHIQSPIRTQTCSIKLLHTQNAIYTNNRSGKTTGMEHYLHHSN
jgi:hypothetical protein